MTLTTLPRSEVAGLSAVAVGQGRPVLLLHGVGLRAEAWEAQIDALSGRHRVIAPDMPGHGDSTCPAGAMTLDGYVDVMLPVLERFAEPAMVVGHSMGALIALELACRAPGQVRAVAALNAVFERSDAAATAVQARAACLDGVTTPDPDPTLARWFGAVASPARAACEAWLRAADPLGYKLAYTAFAHADGPSREALAALHCSALFATGACEPNSTPEMSRRMSKLAPLGRVHIVEGAAHMMPMTHAEPVNEALLSLAAEAWS